MAEPEEVTELVEIDGGCQVAICRGKGHGCEVIVLRVSNSSYIAITLWVTA